MKTTRAIGNEIEEVVVQALQQRGFEIVARNVYTRFGELDIIARKRTTGGGMRKGGAAERRGGGVVHKASAERKKDVVHIIEVKFQSGAEFGGAQMALSAEKFKRMQKSVAQLQQRGELSYFADLLRGPVQFDYAAVRHGPHGYAVSFFENISLADIQR